MPNWVIFCCRCNLHPVLLNREECHVCIYIWPRMNPDSQWSKIENCQDNILLIITASPSSAINRTFLPFYNTTLVKKMKKYPKSSAEQKRQSKNYMSDALNKDKECGGGKERKKKITAVGGPKRKYTQRSSSRIHHVPHSIFLEHAIRRYFRLEL